VGILRQRGTGETIVLGSRCLFGRQARCDVRLSDARVSSEHASLCFTGGGWELRDLGSRNGTFLGDRRLAPGERVLMAEGTSFALGGPSQRFDFIDGRPPTASARHVATGHKRVAKDGFLLLPDDHAPKASLLMHESGPWHLETADAVRDVKDGEIVIVDGDAWQLDLPQGGSETEHAGDEAAASIANVTLRFAVSQDEEHVDVVVLDGARAIQLPPRAYHYLLLTLARVRAADAAASPGERGWVDREELCRMLGTDEYKLNVDVCRARKQLEAAGIRGAARVIERRAGSGKLRLGIERAQIVGL